MLLKQLGFKNVRSLDGGIIAWEELEQISRPGNPLPPLCSRPRRLPVPDPKSNPAFSTQLIQSPDHPTTHQPLNSDRM